MCSVTSRKLHTRPAVLRVVLTSPNAPSSAARSCSSTISTRGRPSNHSWSYPRSLVNAPEEDLTMPSGVNNTGGTICPPHVPGGVDHHDRVWKRDCDRHQGNLIVTRSIDGVARRHLPLTHARLIHKRRPVIEPSLPIARVEDHLAVTAPTERTSHEVVTNAAFAGWAQAARSQQASPVAARPPASRQGWWLMKMSGRLNQPGTIQACTIQ